MVGNDMPFIKSALNQIRKLFGLAANTKESCFDTVFFQNIKHTWCSDGIRAIVKSDGNLIFTLYFVDYLKIKGHANAE